MKDTESNQINQALAQAGTQFGKKSDLIGAPPNDEELAAFLDGRLDETRRAQITAYLAHDDDSYQRWMRLVETVGEAIEIQPAKVENKLSLFERIGALVNQRITVLGGGLATAAVVTVLLVRPLMMTGDINLQIDHLYQDYLPGINQQWSQVSDVEMLKEYSSSRSFSFIPKERTLEQKLLQSGFRRGAETLGADKFRQLNVPVDQLADIQPNEDGQQVLFELGRAAALSYMSCKLQMNQERLDSIAGMLDELLNDSGLAQSESANQLRSALNEKGVCGFADTAYAALDL